jgi:N-acetylmuramoyl-L-alanine amidase
MLLSQNCKAKQIRVMTQKRLNRGILVLLFLCFFVMPSGAQKINTVVLDAGHGGHDTGALGKNSREKDITLSIVLKLRDYIQENLKDVKVILTRDDDTFVELYRRAHIANENKADLFISVHCNSTRSSSPYGVETFVMGLHKSEANLAVAKAENAAILLEDDYVGKYDGFDPNSPEGNIFFSMMQNAFLDRSLEFAGFVEDQFTGGLHLYNRGLKQAGFLVLYKTAMPGVLIETGFISNAKDEKFLLSNRGQSQMANAIFQALCDYKEHIENTKVNRGDPRRILPEVTEPIANPEPEPVQAEETVKPLPVPDEIRADEVVFRVQFAMFPEQKPLNDRSFQGLSDVWMYTHAGSFKYTAGRFSTMDQALRYRKEIIARGYKDAFVVAFRGKLRITNEEAARLTGKK